MREPRKCVICGKEFIPRDSRQVCCSKECTRLRTILLTTENQKKDREAEKAMEAMPESKNKERAEIARKAKKEHLSYGYYVAKYGL